MRGLETRSMMIHRIVEIALLTGLLACTNALRAQPAPEAQSIQLSSGKSYLIDTAVDIDRVSVAAPDFAEAVPVSPRTIIVNGKLAGETSLVVWLSDGTRRQYDITVIPSVARVVAARQQLQKEFGGEVQLTVDECIDDHADVVGRAGPFHGSALVAVGPRTHVPVGVEGATAEGAPI